MEKVVQKFIFVTILVFGFSLPLSAQWIGPEGGQINDIVKVGTTTYAVSNGQAFYSTDAGATWSAYPTLTGLCGYLSSIDVSGSTIVVGLTEACDGNNIYISTNSGASWTPVPTTSGGSSDYIYDVLITGTTIFAVGNNIYATSNGGISWTNNTNPGIGKIQKYGSVVAGYAGSLGGISLSTDGITWNTVTNEITYKSVASFFSDGTTMIAGVDGEGTYISINNGINWTLKANGLTDPYVHSVLINGSTLYAGTEAGLYISSDGGNNWGAITNGLPSSGTIENMVATGSSEVLLSSGYSGIYKSINNGTSWSLSVAGMKATDIRKIIVAGNTLYVSSLSGFFMSSDEGLTWIKTNDNTEFYGLYSMLYTNNAIYAVGGYYQVYFSVSTDNGVTWNNIFVGPVQLTDILFVNNVWLASSNGGIYRSTDSGANWTNVSTDPTWKLAANDDYIYAGGNGDVYRSADDGLTWTTLNTGITNGNSLAVYADGNRIFADGNQSTDNGDHWSVMYHPGNITVVDNPNATGPQKFMFGSYYNSFTESYDNGTNWIPNGENLLRNDGGIGSFAALNEYLYLGTSSQGIYKRPLPALPSLQPLSNYVSCYATNTDATQPLSAQDPYTPADSLTYYFTSDNNSLYANGITVEGYGSSRVMRVANSNYTAGTATVTAVVSNYDHLTDTVTFTYQVTFNATTPVISLQDLAVDTLICSAAGTSYEWFLNGQTITGETAKKLEVTTDGDYIVKFTDANGCISTSSAVYTYHADGSGTTGIKDLSEEAHIRYYPNPAHQALYMTWDANKQITKIRLINAMGAEMYESSNNAGESSWTINLENYQTGLYWIELSNDENKFVKKIVVE